MSRPLEVDFEIGMPAFATEDAKDSKDTRDAKEGPRASAEKRAPMFVGR